MNASRLEERVQRLRSIVRNVEDILQGFSSPAFDEDYKVEREVRLTEHAFDMVESFANELEDKARRHLAVWEKS
jgi:hypothetical protein